MNKKAFILHGMSGTIDTSFGIKLKEDLKKLNYQIFQPTFTIGKDITLTSWFEQMDKIKDEIDDNSIFICHSLGCLFIVKYFIKNKIKNKLIISVAGGINNRAEVRPGFEYLDAFILEDSEMKEFRRLNNKVYDIYSDNDPIYNKMVYFDRYVKETNATPVFLPGRGHFGATSGVKEIPEIVEIIRKKQLVQ